VLLRGLGIDGLGKTVARTLAERFGTLAHLRAASHSELAAIKGLGEVSAGTIRGGLLQQTALLDDLLGHITVETEAKATGDGPLSGLSFVFTGALTIDRKSAEARVRSLGAQTPSSVTKTLTHLVVGGDRASPSTKQQAAEKLNGEGARIVVLDEAGFEALLATHGSASTMPPDPSPAGAPAPTDATLPGPTTTMTPTTIDAATATTTPPSPAPPTQKQLPLF